jgi:chromosome segregation ATPase
MDAALERQGKALLEQLQDVSTTNVALRSHVEMQARELSMLQESSRAQQQLLADFERQGQQVRQSEAASLEARTRAAAAEREVRFQAELAETQAKAAREREELLKGLARCDSERAQREGERDELRTRVAQVELQLEALQASSGQMRAQAMEMETNLLRSRFAREEEARTEAERALEASKAREQHLQATVERQASELTLLRGQLSEKHELVNFRQEVCNDLQLQLQEQKLESERRVDRERNKMRAVARLDGVLPKNMLMRALSQQS